MDEYFAALLTYFRIQLDMEWDWACRMRAESADPQLRSAAADRLSDIAAKRALLDMEHEFGPHSELHGGEDVWRIAVCRLAQQYEGRPGWRSEWAS